MQTARRRHRDRGARVPLVLTAGVHVDVGGAEDHGGDLRAGRAHRDHDAAQGLGDVVGDVGRSAPRHDDPRALAGRGRREHGGLRGGEHEIECRQGHGTDDGLAAQRHRHVHGPVAPARLAELPCAVQRVDDPQAALSGHVLEPLLGPDVVIGVETRRALAPGAGATCGRPPRRCHAVPGGRLAAPPGHDPPPGPGVQRHGARRPGLRA